MYVHAFMNIYLQVVSTKIVKNTVKFYKSKGKCMHTHTHTHKHIKQVATYFSKGKIYIYFYAYMCIKYFPKDQ
jgi:hypothetical protein